MFIQGVLKVNVEIIPKKNQKKRGTVKEGREDRRKRKIKRRRKWKGRKGKREAKRS